MSYVMSCLMSCHVLCHVMSMSCLMSCHVYVMSYVMSCLMSCHVLCHAMSYVMSCPSASQSPVSSRPVRAAGRSEQSVRVRERGVMSVPSGASRDSAVSPSARGHRMCVSLSLIGAPTRERGSGAWWYCDRKHAPRPGRGSGTEGCLEMAPPSSRTLGEGGGPETGESGHPAGGAVWGGSCHDRTVIFSDRFGT